MNTNTIKNYLYNLSYQILILITPLITTPYTARVLQSNGIGIYSYTTSVATIFSIFAALGVNMYGQREIAYHQKDLYKRSAIFWELVITRAVTTLIVTGFYLIFCLFAKNYQIYFWLQSFIVFAVMFDISWFFQGIENFKVIATRNCFIKIISIFLIFFLVKKPEDLGVYVLLISLSSLFSNVIFFLNLKGEIVTVPLKELNLTKHLKGSLEFFIPVVAVQIYSQVDKIMLGIIAQDIAENGYYEQTRKLVTILVMVVTSINTVMYPKIAKLYSQGRKEEMRGTLQATYKIILMMLTPIVIGLLIVSDNLVSWFFGEGYEPVSILLKLSGWLIVFMAIGNFVSMQYLSPTGQQNKGTLIYIAAAIINLLLNSFMIVLFQSLGAIIASIVAEAFSGIAQLCLLMKSEYRINLTDEVWKYLCSSGFMAICLILLNSVNPYKGMVRTIMELFVAVTSYGIFLVFLKESNSIAVLNIFKRILNNV